MLAYPEGYVLVARPPGETQGDPLGSEATIDNNTYDVIVEKLFIELSKIMEHPGWDAERDCL